MTPEEQSLCLTHRQRLQAAKTCLMCEWLEANTNKRLLEVEAERDALREKADALDWLGANAHSVVVRKGVEAMPTLLETIQAARRAK